MTSPPQAENVALNSPNTRQTVDTIGCPRILSDVRGQPRPLRAPVETHGSCGSTLLPSVADRLLAASRAAPRETPIPLPFQADSACRMPISLERRSRPNRVSGRCRTWVLMEDDHPAGARVPPEPQRVPWATRGQRPPRLHPRSRLRCHLPNRYLLAVARGRSGQAAGAHPVPASRSSPPVRHRTNPEPHHACSCRARRRTVPFGSPRARHPVWPLPAEPAL